jgi:hypothetical protein
MDDDEFIRKYEAHEAESIDDFIARSSTNQSDLQDAISFLIRRRELLRDCELERLEEQARELIAKLRGNKQEMLLEELECFKEVLSLHRRLLQHDQSPG